MLFALIKKSQKNYLYMFEPVNYEADENYSKTPQNVLNLDYNSPLLLALNQKNMSLDFLAITVPE